MAPILTMGDIKRIQVEQILDSDVESDRGLEGLVMYEATLYQAEYVQELGGIRGDPIRTAAEILHLITAFWEGNKRTAFVSADMILRFYGMYLMAEPEEIVKFMKGVATPGAYAKEDIVAWVDAHAKKS